MVARRSPSLAEQSIDEQERHFVDLIYATLVDQNLWTTFVEDVAACHPNGHATLFSHDATAACGTMALNAGFEADWIDRYNTYYVTRNPWVARAHRRPVGVGARPEATLPRAELTTTEFYADFLRPQEISTGVGVTILRDETSIVALSVIGAPPEEARGDALAELFGRLSPHLRRVFDICRRDRSDPLKTMAPLFETLDAAIFVIGEGRRLAQANGLAETMLNEGRFVRLDAGGRVVVDVAEAGDALDRLTRGGDIANPTASWLARDRDGAPARVSLVAGGQSPIEVFFGGPRAFLLIEPLDTPDTLTAATLRTLYDLTPAEARLMIALAGGASLQEAAARFGISRETARTQFRRICVKMGVSRQAEAVRLACRAGRGVLRVGEPAGPQENAGRAGGRRAR